MNSIIEACINRSRTIVLLFLLIIISGVLAYNSIPKEREPDVQIPVIYVMIKHEGISPSDGERLLIKPMEKELRTIEGLKELKSSAIEGSASVILEFDAGFDSEKALSDVREKVDIAKAELPDDAEEPTVNEINLSLFPVVNVIMKGDISIHTMVSSARNLRDKIEEIANVLDVNIAGDREEVVELIIDPLKLESYKLTLEEVNNVAKGFNKLVAAGNLDTSEGRYVIKVPGLIEDVNDILELPLRANGDSVLKVRDVAHLKKTFKDATGYARANGEPAIVLEVSKRSGTNIIETIDEVKKVVETEQKFLPPGINITYSQDGSNEIISMITDLQNNIILAVLLVMLVIVLVVGTNSATLVALSIPGAFLFGILMLNGFGFTLNIVVLFSLILSIGMLVDTSIIVTEMADRKIMDGVFYKDAYATASKYMSWPIITSTLTTLVVFMPLLVWPGIVGQFMKYLPITLIATLTGSLLMAVVFIPTLGTLLGRKKFIDKKYAHTVYLTEEGNLDELHGIQYSYYKLLKFVLSHPVKVIFIILLLLVGTVYYFVNFGKGTEFFPNIEPDNGAIQIVARGNLSVEEKDQIVKEVEDKILDLSGKEVRVFFSKSGDMEGSGRENLTEDTIGLIQMEYADWRQRKTAIQIDEIIQERTKNIAGIIVKGQEEKPGPKGSKPIEIEIGSRDSKLLVPATEIILKVMNDIGGFRSVEDTRPVPAIEWETVLNREMAARFGINVEIVGAFIKLVTKGLRMSTYRPNESDDEVDIVLRFPESKRNLSTLDSLKINSANGAVPMSNFINREARPKLGKIDRVDSLRVITIRSDVEDGIIVNNKLSEIKERLSKMNFDPRLRIKFKGDDEEQNQAASFLKNAFILAIFMMALILVTQFNSIYNMLIILSAVFLSTVGVLLGLIVTNQPFGIVMCGVGVISLSGIVVNNNIIFIDTFQKLKKTGMNSYEALVRTGLQRLRPILLTAGTTVLGLIPMVLGMNINFLTREITFGSPSSQWWTQLSTSIAGGLAFATILTLLFTPSLLLIGDKVSSKVKSMVKSRRYGKQTQG